MLPTKESSQCRRFRRTSLNLWVMIRLQRPSSTCRERSSCTRRNLRCNRHPGHLVILKYKHMSVVAYARCIARFSLLAAQHCLAVHMRCIYDVHSIRGPKQAWTACLDCLYRCVMINTDRHASTCSRHLMPPPRPLPVCIARTCACALSKSL